MKVERYENQSLLVAVDRDGLAYAMAAIGCEASENVESSGAMLVDCLEFATDDVPKDPGVHVWEGVVTIKGGGDVILWEGPFRRATAADFARFGVPLGEGEAVANG